MPDTNLAESIDLVRPRDSARRAAVAQPPTSGPTGMETLAGRGVAARDPEQWGLAVRAMGQRALEEPAAPAPAPAAQPAAPAQKIQVAPALEIQIGRSNFLPFWFLELGLTRGRAVCKVKASGTNYLGQTGHWSGTGFMVSPNILLTNHHVLNSHSVAAQAACIFDYQEDQDGNLRQTTGFQVRPERLFLTSPVGGGGLDYTFVWVDGQPGATFGFVPLDRSSFPVVEREFVNVIQHPSGGPKTVALQENEVVWQDPAILHYETDTQPGSSGSCVFTNEWRPVALHHASVPSPAGRTLNEGIKLSAIAVHLEKQQRDPALRSQAEEVLRLFGGSDELLGFFGSLGRTESEGETGLEAVVDRYQGEAQDVDVAFWNIEWFNRRYEEKLEAVGEVVARMNLDVWALEETSPEATAALAAHLKDRYGLDFAWAPSEPDAPSGKQTTTVLWNQATVSGKAVPWPDEIDAWLRVHSTDFASLGLEAVEGKVFDRYPGLFYFEALNRGAGREPFNFHLVPLHLKAMDEGSKRRRMASRILLAAVNRMTERHDADADWVLGGDFNAPLASEDFAALTGAGLVPLSAEDEEAGSFSYLKRPRSLIDHVFLSPNLARTYGARDYFIVAEDRALPSFVREVSDHRPVLVRLSLKDTTEAPTAGLPADLSAEMVRLFGREGAAERPARVSPAA